MLNIHDILKFIYVDVRKIQCGVSCTLDFIQTCSCDVVKAGAEPLARKEYETSVVECNST